MNQIAKLPKKEIMVSNVSYEPFDMDKHPDYRTLAEIWLSLTGAPYNSQTFFILPQGGTWSEYGAFSEVTAIKVAVTRKKLKEKLLRHLEEIQAHPKIGTQYKGKFFYYPVKETKVFLIKHIDEEIAGQLEDTDEEA
jgi:hypothetical protein